jgi:protein-disulfide isomerase
MNAKRVAVAVVALVALLAFFFGSRLFQARQEQQQERQATQAAVANADRLVRMHSPVIGRADAPVTIVEFFDPACESCRAFYPVVKQIMARHPNDVRLVLRYAAFHQGSDQVIKLLDAARRQGKLVPVLEAVLAAQPQWADHGNPNVQIAFDAAGQAGMDVQRAIGELNSPLAEGVLRQDTEDVKALNVTRTPTFFVNGRALASFGPDQLAALVAAEVAAARKR